MSIHSAYNHQQYLKHRDKILIRHKEWGRKHSEERKKYYKEWRLANKDKEQEKQKRHNKKSRLEVLTFYSGNPPKCQCCNEKTLEFLTIDHINNDGRKHRKETKTTLVKWIRKNNFPKGFQILCYNCNCAKGVYGECPHQGSTFS